MATRSTTSPHRRRGEGSAPQLRKDGSWTVKYHDAQHVRRSLYGRDPDALMARLRVILAERDNGTPTHRTRMTLGSWLDTWLVGYAASPRTAERYRFALDTRWRWHRALMATALPKVSTEVLEAVLERQAERGDSAASRRYGLKVMHAALAEAYQRGHVGHNAAARVRPIRHDPAPISVLEADEQARLRPYLLADGLAAAWTLALDYGLRQGEILGLDWTDVDLERGLVRVSRTAHDDGTVDLPKSRTSNRLLHVEGPTLAALRDRSARFMAPVSGPLFLAPTDGRGTRGPARLARRMTGRQLRDAWYVMLALAGVRQVKFHTMRHTMLTDEAERGTSLALLQGVAGHASLAQTSAYLHVRALRLPGRGGD